MPKASVVNEPNGTIVELVWKYWQRNYQWHTRIVTENYSLSENNLNEPIIDKLKGREYNFTTHENDSNITVVTLSILISDSVLQYFPYIFCRIFRISSSISTDYSVEKYESNDIVLQLQTSSSSTAQPVFDEATSSKNVDAVSSPRQTTVSEDSKPCLDSGAILLLFVHVIIAVQSRF